MNGTTREKKTLRTSRSGQPWPCCNNTWILRNRISWKKMHPTCYWSRAQNPNVRRIQICGLQVTSALKVRAKLPYPQEGPVCNSPCPQEMAMLLRRNTTSHNSNRTQIFKNFQATVYSKLLTSSWMKTLGIFHFI